MSFQLTGYRVFIASPSGLEEERNAFVKIIEEYNKEEAVHRGIIFQAIGWEETLPGLGRPQSLINEELKTCDYFILLLHDRWGSFPGTNEKGATSGTEEEYLLALDCQRSKDYPMKQIACLFKEIPPRQLSDPGRELQKVLDFKKQLESEKILLYSTFSTLNEFNKLIKRNLSRWLRDGENPTIIENYIPPVEPVDSDSSSTPMLDKSEPLLDKEQVEPASKEIIANAWQLAKSGRLVEAEVEFSKALINDSKEYQLLNYSKFLINIGRLDQSLIMVNKALEIAKTKGNLNMVSTALSFKAEIFTTRGDLKEAEEMYKQSLRINEQLNRSGEIANQMGNLGMLLHTKGKLEEAESLIKKSLQQYENLDDLNGMAIQYSNLGIILKTKGEPEEAKKMFTKALDINKELGDEEGISYQYGNLGILFNIDGDVDEAEKMFTKALEIDERLGRSEGMALGYGNLGIVEKTKGNLDQAEKLFKKALDINEKLGRLHGVASQYGNLGTLYLNRGDLVLAEQMYNKAFEIAEAKGFAQILEIANLGLEKVSQLNKPS